MYTYIPFYVHKSVMIHFERGCCQNQPLPISSSPPIVFREKLFQLSKLLTAVCRETKKRKSVGFKDMFLHAVILCLPASQLMKGCSVHFDAGNRLIGCRIVYQKVYMRRRLVDVALLFRRQLFRFSK